MAQPRMLKWLRHEVGTLLQDALFRLLLSRGA